MGCGVWWDVGASGVVWYVMDMTYGLRCMVGCWCVRRGVVCDGYDIWVAVYGGMLVRGVVCDGYDIWVVVYGGMLVRGVVYGGI